ncbi:MAG: M1 family metallopeptidase, partial [Clostridia bacterium]|nr:M1 family metallopeptidase [Clostridia bacterium]
EQVSLLEEPLNFEAEKYLLKINLNEPLKPMESAVITFKYKTVLPKGLERFGYYDTCYKLTGFYPVAVVYENGWKLEKLSAIGDPAFSDMADYHFTLRVPSGFTVAATGEKELISSDESGDTYRITAKNVRDMAVVADTELKEYETKAGETTIKAYAYTDEQAELLKTYAADSLIFFNNSFGTYPYSTYSVVTSKLFSGGMEYPTLVLISHQLFNTTEKAFLEWTVAHETAHQWWYGLVGSNPVTEAFMDESLTEYSTLQYIRNKYDEETYEKMKSTFILLPYSAYNAFYDGKAIARPISEYESMLEFSMLVYVKGCMMFMEMENIMGKETLMQALKSYYETYAYSSASFSDFKEHLSQSFEYDWDGFFKKWLEQG